MKFSKFFLVTLGVVFLVLASVGGTAYFLIKKDTKNSVLAAYTSKINIPLYDSSSDKYEIQEDKTTIDEGSVLISSYKTQNGIINMAQQPKPTTESLEKTTPIDKFVTPIGEAKLFPNQNNDPFIIIETPVTWVILSTNDQKLTSAELKKFALTLKQLPE